MEPVALDRNGAGHDGRRIWVFIKLPQEWWIHIAQLDFTDFMADYPFMWVVLLAVAVIVAIVIWTQRKRIPQRRLAVHRERRPPPSTTRGEADGSRQVLHGRAAREGGPTDVDLGDLRSGPPDLAVDQSGTGRGVSASWSC